MEAETGMYKRQVEGEELAKRRHEELEQDEGAVAQRKFQGS